MTSAEIIADVESSRSDELSAYRRSTKDDLAFFLKGIEEVTKQARSILVVLTTACAFVLVAAMSPENDKSIKLPFVGNELPGDTFFTLSPLVILAIYIYLQVYIQELRGRFARLHEFCARVVIPEHLIRDLLFPWFFLMALEDRRHAENRNDQDQFARSGVRAVYTVPFLYPFSVFVVWLMGPIVLGVLWVLFLSQGKTLALIPCGALILSGIIAIRSIKSSMQKTISLLVGILFALIGLLTFASVERFRSQTYLAYLWQARFTIEHWIDAESPRLTQTVFFIFAALIIHWIFDRFYSLLRPLRTYRKALARQLEGLTSEGTRIKDIYFPVEGTLRGNPGTMVSIESVLDQYSRVLILGPLGSGKTTALINTALKLASLKRNGIDYAPVYIRLAQPAEARTLVEVAADTMAKYGIAKGGLLFSELARRGRVAFLLDGLDEIPSKQSYRVDEIKALMERFPTCLFFVSSRIIGYKSKLDESVETVFKIEPFSDAAIQVIVERRFSDRSTAREFLEQLKRLPFTEWRNPRYLVMFMKFFEQTGTLPNSIVELIVLTIEMGNTNSPAHEIEEFLRLLGTSMRYQDQHVLNREAWSQLASQVMRAHADSRPVDDFLNDMLGLGLLRVQEDGISFVHRTVQEYFGMHS